MANPLDLTGNSILSTYQRVLQIDNNNIVLNGTGSIISELEVTASYAATASYVLGSIASASYAVTAVTASYISPDVISDLLNNAGSSVSINLGEDTAINATVGEFLLYPTASYIKSKGISGDKSYTFKFLNDEPDGTGANGTNVTDASEFGYVEMQVGKNILVSYPLAKSLIVSDIFQGDLLGTAETASLALTASYVENANTASYVENAQTASYVENANTASYVENAQTASYVENAQTASYVELAQTASLAITASYAFYAVSASHEIIKEVSSSYADTASYVENAQTASLAITSSHALFALTASYAISASHEIIKEVSSSHADNADFAITASHALTSVDSTTADTASYIDPNTIADLLNSAGPSVSINLKEDSPISASLGILTIYPTQSYIDSLGTTSPAYVYNFQNDDSPGGFTEPDMFGRVQIIVGQAAAIDRGPTEVDSKVVATRFEGDLLGTASLATTASYALTASYLLGGSPGSSGFITSNDSINLLATAVAITGSGTNSELKLYPTGSTISSNYSYVFANLSASTAQVEINLDPFAFGPKTTVTAEAFIGTASWADNAVNAETASYVETAQTASYVLEAVSSSLAQTASLATTASYALVAQTLLGNIQNADTASYVVNAFTASYVENAQTASLAITASYIETASHAFSAYLAANALYANTASYVENAQTASLATNATNAETASYIDGPVDFLAATTYVDGYTINIQASQSIGGAVARYNFINTSNGEAVRLIAGTTSTAIAADDFFGTASLATKAITATTADTATSASHALKADLVDLVAGPGIEINGLEITSSLRSVNGVFPTNGNVVASLAGTITGTSASLVASSSGAVTGSLNDAILWVISGDADTTKNGLAYIWNSGSVGAWLPIASSDTATNDARYLKLDGTNSPLQGDVNGGGFTISNINITGSITNANAATTAATASYVLNAVSASHADNATTASYVSNVNLAAGPGIEINGLEITSSLRTVNGITPTNGNVAISLSATYTGTSASLVSQNTSSLADASIWVISGETLNPELNGESYIWASSSQEWLALANISLSQGDARYLRLDGGNDPMIGSLDMGLNSILNANIVSPSIVGASIFSGVMTGSFLGDLIGTASYATTASYVESASYAFLSFNAQTANLAGTAFTASYVLNAISSSHALTASYVLGGSETASYALTASYFNGTIETASYALTASYVETANTASYVLSASYATDASQSINSIYAISANSANTALLAETANTASYVVNAQTASYLDGNVSKLAENVYLKNYQLNFSPTFNSPGAEATYRFINPTAGEEIRFDVTDVSSSIMATNFYGTASYVETAQTASYFGGAISKLGQVVTITGSGGVSFYPEGQVPTQYVFNAVASASNPNPRGQIIFDFPADIFGNNTATIYSPNFEGNFIGTASWATNANTASYFNGIIETASYAYTASYVTTALTSTTASYALTASYLLGSSETASYALTASYVENSQTASYVENAQTASLATTASYALYAETTSGTITNAISSSYAATASLLLGSIESASYAINASTASYVENAITASYVETANTASYILNAVSSSYALTASYLAGGIEPFPYTGSAEITGSLVVDGFTGLGGEVFVSNSIVLGDDQTINSFRLRISGSSLAIEKLTGVSTWTSVGSFS